jgi:hypothetical protein
LPPRDERRPARAARWMGVALTVAVRQPRRRRWLIVVTSVTSLSGAAPALAQTPADPHAAQPERPTVATHAGTVAPGWVELESGVEIDRFADHSRGGSTPTLLKIGVASHVQLDLAGAYVSAPGDGAGHGVGDLAVGVKWRLLDHAPVLGRFAIQPSLKLPSGSVAAGTGTGTTDLGVLLISSNNIGPVEIDVNAGYTKRSGAGVVAPRTATLWTTSFGGPAAGPVGWCAELFGYPRTAGLAGARATVAVLAGPTFQPRPWLVFDTGVIVPLSGPQPHGWYLGGVWNIGRAF